MKRDDKYYMSIAQSIAADSQCIRRKVGAVLVPIDAEDIVTAINDPVPDKYICKEEGCLREVGGIGSGTEIEVCRCVHAETSLIVKCALNEVSPRGASIYTTLLPCSACARILCAAGIKRVIFAERYPLTDALAVFAQFGVEAVQLDL